MSSSDRLDLEPVGDETARARACRRPSPPRASGPQDLLAARRHARTAQRRHSSRPRPRARRPRLGVAGDHERAPERDDDLIDGPLGVEREGLACQGRHRGRTSSQLPRLAITYRPIASIESRFSGRTSASGISIFVPELEELDQLEHAGRSRWRRPRSASRTPHSCTRRRPPESSPSGTCGARARWMRRRGHYGRATLPASTSSNK